MTDDNAAQSLLAEFGMDALDLDQVEVPTYDIPDGPYEFTVGDLFIKKGSKNQPDKAWIILEYLVGEGGKRFSELWEVPKDIHNMTEDEVKRMGRYKGRLVSLGVDESRVNQVTRDEVVGITGTFQLRTTEGKGGRMYQNVRNLRVDSDGLNEFAQPESDPEEAASAAKTVKPRPAPKAKAPTAVDNPFAKKAAE